MLHIRVSHDFKKKKNKQHVQTGKNRSSCLLTIYDRFSQLMHLQYGRRDHTWNSSGESSVTHGRCLLGIHEVAGSLVSPRHSTKLQPRPIRYPFLFCYISHSYRELLWFGSFWVFSLPTSFALPKMGKFVCYIIL